MQQPIHLRAFSFSAGFGRSAKLNLPAWVFNCEAVAIQQASPDQGILAVGKHDLDLACFAKQTDRTGEHEFLSLGAVSQFDKLLADQFKAELHGEANG